MRVYYDRDADLNLIKGKKVAVIGYGSQGHAHALNLRDSGVKDVAVALRKGSQGVKKAEGEKLKVMEVAEAAKWADVMMMLTPDELQGDIYRDHLARQHEERRRADVRAWPQRAFQPDRAARRPRRADDRAEGPRPYGALGISARRRRAVPDRRSTRTPPATPTISACRYASAIGGGRAGIIETTFKEECETDLFGEQTVLCGGLVELIKAGYETLVEAGYAPEMAYFECLHEVKLIVDLIYEGGIANMNYSISNTAEYGEYVSGPRIITAETKAEMKRILADIQSGKFTRDWMLENKVNQTSFKATRAKLAEHRHREGRRQAARDDAVDQAARAGGQDEELIADFASARDATFPPRLVEPSGRFAPRRLELLQPAGDRGGDMAVARRRQAGAGGLSAAVAETWRHLRSVRQTRIPFAGAKPSRRSAVTARRLRA